MQTIVNPWILRGKYSIYLSYISAAILSLVFNLEKVPYGICATMTVSIPYMTFLIIPTVMLLDHFSFNVDHFTFRKAVYRDHQSEYKSTTEIRQVWRVILMWIQCTIMMLIIAPYAYVYTFYPEGTITAPELITPTLVVCATIAHIFYNPYVTTLCVKHGNFMVGHDER